MIGAVLLQAVTADPDVEVISEAANAIFDVYSEDHLHVQALKQLALVDKLQAFVPVFVQKVCTATGTRCADTVDDECVPPLLAVCWR